MARKTELAKKFQATMRVAGAPKRGGTHEILGQFDWTNLHGKTIVDVSCSKIDSARLCLTYRSQVGGSTGHIAAVIAKAHPNIRIVVQDLPEVVQRATAPNAPPMPDNVSFQPHNFFAPQNCYLLMLTYTVLAFTIGQRLLQRRWSKP